MTLRTGVDLLEIERLESAIERFGDRFLTRVFTPAELILYRQNPFSLAARFAAKEAVAKALGCGIGQVAWREIEILSGPSHEPVLHLHGQAAAVAQALDLQTWSLSLSHTRRHAIAFVVAL